jgi:hypothetical protein
MGQGLGRRSELYHGGGKPLSFERLTKVMLIYRCLTELLRSCTQRSAPSSRISVSGDSTKQEIYYVSQASRCNITFCPRKTYILFRWFVTGQYRRSSFRLRVDIPRRYGMGSKAVRCKQDLSLICGEYIVTLLGFGQPPS